MATLNLFVKLQFRFFGQGPTLNETTNETVTSFYFKVSILHYVQTNPDIFELNHILSYTNRPCVHTKPVNPITETTALQSG